VHERRSVDLRAHRTAAARLEQASSDSQEKRHFGRRAELCLGTVSSPVCILACVHVPD